MLFELGVQWSLIGGDVVKYQYNHRLPLRANTTQDYAESAPRDATVEAHATHLLATCLQQSTAIVAFEFDGVELILKREGNTSHEMLHELAAASLSYVMGCTVSIWSAQA